MENTKLIRQLKELLHAKESGLLGDCTMPEDTHPTFSNPEEKLAYFTLPMALNYQRDSFALWVAAKKTFDDPETHDVFDIRVASSMPIELLQSKLLKHKLALQPNKHIDTWRRIATTIGKNWESFEGFMSSTEGDFRVLRQTIQQTHKKDFPYLSGPKIFNYWSFIIQEYGDVHLSHSDEIEIAPDTHIIKCSVRLGVITSEESATLTREEISAKWRKALLDSDINPIQLHPALWFWSRGNFTYQLS